jgi:hypothetical protein
MCSPPALAVPLLLVALVACRDPDAPRPVAELESPPPTGAPRQPLTSRDGRAEDTRPVATRPRPSDLPDPAEPGIPDLARLARYVFAEMHAVEDVCSFSNPLPDPLSFAFHVDVRAGRMTQTHLAWAGVRARSEIRRLESVPPELTAYVSCLTPRLEAVRMDPAPADGTYQPEYGYPGHGGVP